MVSFKHTMTRIKKSFDTPSVLHQTLQTVKKQKRKSLPNSVVISLFIGIMVSLVKMKNTSKFLNRNNKIKRIQFRLKSAYSSPNAWKCCRTTTSLGILWLATFSATGPFFSFILLCKSAYMIPKGSSSATRWPLA